MTTSKKKDAAGNRPEVANSAFVDGVVIRLHTMVSGSVEHRLSAIGHLLLTELDAEGTRAVLRRCDSVELPVSRTFLARAIAVARLERQLPEDARFCQLPVSHRVELVKVRDPIVVERLATIALGSKMSVQKLRALVRREVTRSRSTRGPKPVVEVLRVLRKVERVVSALQVGELSREQQVEIAQLVEHITLRMQELSRQLNR